MATESAEWKWPIPIVDFTIRKPVSKNATYPGPEHAMLGLSSAMGFNVELQDELDGVDDARARFAPHVPHLVQTRRGGAG